MSENNQKNLNKREFARIDLKDPIRLIKKNGAVDEFLGDLSKTGCNVFSIDEIDSGSRVQIGIKDPLTEEYVNFSGIVRRCVPLFSEKKKPADSSIYKCFTCKYKSQKVELESKWIKWQSIPDLNQKLNQNRSSPIYDYLQRPEEGEWIICPRCSSESFVVSEGNFFEFGIEFIDLNETLNEVISRVIMHSTNAKKTGRRANSRVDGQLLCIDMDHTFGSGVDLYQAHLMDFSRGGAKVNVDKEYEIGQDINLTLGLKDLETIQVPSQIVHRRKAINGFEYGLKFKFFDEKTQTELNHLINDLALGDYRAHNLSKVEEQVLESSFDFNLVSFLVGLALATLIFGSFYFLGSGSP